MIAMRLSMRSIILSALFLGGVLAFLRWGLPGNNRPPDASAVVHELLGAEESCVRCHGSPDGFSPSHRPAVMGCSPCHGGDPRAADREPAHRGIILVPGNMADVRRTCGAANCHQDITHRVEHSLMASLSGIVSVDRYVFGEIEAPHGLFHIEEIGQSPADSHLRHLCASCHLGNAKTETGPITELSRGGGCNACHLKYGDRSLGDWRAGDQPMRHHPALTVAVTNDHCFGCHARSSRISLNYEGWHETAFTAEEVDLATTHYRLLEDGRILEYVQDDVHHQAGLDCIDCHHVNELMGDGNLYQHKEEALRVSCEDCHQADFSRTFSYQALDTESKKLLALRGVDGLGKRFLATSTDLPLINAWLDTLGRAGLQGKNNGRWYALPAPAAICTRGGGHARLSCEACHTSWAPQCIGCHNTFEPNAAGFDLLDQQEVRGKWVEHVGVFFHDAPTLGIAKSTGLDAETVEKIKAFIPGMVLSIELNSFPGKEGPPIFHRLYAPTAAHTTRAVGRSCTSCHNNPLALGYGRGALGYQRTGNRGRWTFSPEYVASPEDGLPQDAWIGFLREPPKNASTRTSARPFSLAEQQRILTVGACLTCHQEKEPMMLEAIEDFTRVLRRRTPACVLPAWE